MAKWKHIKTRQDFIDRANERHGGFYSYEKVKFTQRPPVKNWKGELSRKTPEYYRDEKITITCPIHGDFIQTARKHIEKDPHGCPKCARISMVVTRQKHPAYRGTIEKRAEKAKTTFNKKYRLLRLQKLAKRKLVAFHSSPEYLTEVFIEKSKSIWGENKYDYSLVWYDHDLWGKDNEKYLWIGCKEHGYYKQRYTNHYRYGCSKCAKKELSKRTRMDIDELVSKLKKVHGDKYDYSDLIKNYTGMNKCKHRDENFDRQNRSKKYTVVCKEHGPFETTMHKHLYRGHGCPDCNPTVSHGEKVVRKIFEKIYDGHKFKKIRPDWLRNPQTNCKLELDGYNEELKIAFEYNGIQHYEPVKLFGGEENFLKIKQRDDAKRILCKEKGVQLIEIDGRQYKNMSLPKMENKLRKHIRNRLKIHV